MVVNNFFTFFDIFIDTQSWVIFFRWHIFYSNSNNDALLEFNKRYPTNKQLEDKLREIIDKYSKDGEIKIKEIIKNINN